MAYIGQSIVRDKQINLLGEVVGQELAHERVVVVLSGGMDSTTLLYDVVKQGKEVFAIIFDYGQRHSRELHCARATCERLNVPVKYVNLKVLSKIAPSALTREAWTVPEGNYDDENMKATVVPNRNMVMLSIATSYALGIEAVAVYYGAHAGDHSIYPDCRPGFVNAMRQVLFLCDWSPIELRVPYLYIDKGDIAVIGRELRVDYSLTHTCYNGTETPCEKCGACRERAEAFEKAGMRDPLLEK